MEWLNLGVFAVLALAVSAVAVGFVWLINRNLKQGVEVREKVAQRAESLRMSRMLKALGFDLQHYVHQVPLTRIHESMGQCENCSTTDQCDDALAKNEVEVGKIDFCPNHECLGRYAELSSESR